MAGRGGGRGARGRGKDHGAGGGGALCYGVESQASPPPFPFLSSAFSSAHFFLLYSRHRWIPSTSPSVAVGAAAAPGQQPASAPPITPLPSAGEEAGREGERGGREGQEGRERSGKGWERREVGGKDTKIHEDPDTQRDLPLPRPKTQREKWLISAPWITSGMNK